MDNQLLAAAENHARWCDLLCRSHGIPTVMEDRHWAALRRPPEPCPDAVTVAPGATADDVLRRAPDESRYAVGDSFAELDLAGLGFDEIMRGSWIFRHPLLPTVDAAAVWSLVQSEEELAAWVLAAGAGAAALGPELLSEPSLRFLVATGRQGMEAGAIATLSAEVVGVWNVFTSKAMDALEVWRTLPTAIANHFPMVSLVGCEEGDALAAALHHRCTEIGTSRVWRRAGGGEG